MLKTAQASYILGFAGLSGAGKTTLIEKILPLLTTQLQVAVIKSTHHQIEVDKPGKDSYRYRQAGAQTVLLAAPNATMLLQTPPQLQAEQLPALIEKLPPPTPDLVLFEGFKQAQYDKIWVYRSDLGEFPHALLDSHCIAIACDQQADLKGLEENTNIARLDINAAANIASFVNHRIHNVAKKT
jgi:molybdopterin-guanine dinucleotide biosynthesis protein B